MLFLSPRLQLSAVVKRQIIEGVMAVVFLNHQSQQSNRITIQIFDRRGEGEATYDRMCLLHSSLIRSAYFL